MNNKKILRRALPFIIIFAISLAIALYTFIQQNLPGSKAADETLSVNIANVRDPIATNETWEWNMLATTDRNPSTPIVLTYTANWCLDHTHESPCIQGATEDYFYQVGSGELTVNARQTTAKIRHQSVNCGRVQVELQYEGKTVALATHTTNTKCTANMSGSVSEYVDSPAQLIEVINQFLKTILGLLDEDNNSDDKTNPIGEEPGTPSEPSNPGLCKAAGESCNETYREACGQGEDAGTRICYKYGTCVAPGSGVQCSWGTGSFCDPCESGKSISDPVPPIKPPQVPPEQPGNPPGQPVQPLPPVSNSDAQEVVDLVSYIKNNCQFPNFDFGSKVESGLVADVNAAKCMAAFSNSKNDGHTKTEIIDSAVGYKRLQCVGFTEAAVAAASGRSYDGPGGHAYQRATSNSSYELVSPSQRPAAPNNIAVWKSTAKVMPFGHVAYIVQANQNTITVLEANFTETLSNGQKHPCWGCVREKTYVIREEQNQRNFAGWLQKR